MKEKKKKSKKSKYCDFEGILNIVKSMKNMPKKIPCPECKRKMEPTVDFNFGDIILSFKKHRRKK